jgi:hypothetical protein
VKQRRFYSGKKKAHTMKNQVVVYRRPGDGRPVIAALSASREGKIHDKKIYNQARMTTPRNIKRVADTGYQGTVMETPCKKPKGKQLTPEQKNANREFSSKRVKVEHGIGAMKRFGIAGQRWRNPRKTRTIIIKNVAGLANWAAA